MVAHLEDARALLRRASAQAEQLALPAEIRPIARSGRGRKALAGN